MTSKLEHSMQLGAISGIKQLETSISFLKIADFCCFNFALGFHAYLLTGDRRQARHFYLAKQFCFLDADCLVVGESQGSSRRSVGKYPVKPPRRKVTNHWYIPMQEPLIVFSIIDSFYWQRQWDSNLHGRGT